MIKTKEYVYLLRSTTNPRRVYIGYTNTHPFTRLLKHNGIKNGGARKTRKYRPWEVVFFVSGFPSSRIALQMEFVSQHPPKKLRKRGGGIKSKMRIMKSLLNQEKICSTAIPNKNLKLILFFMKQEYYDLWCSI